jgi:hypothetical protein
VSKIIASAAANSLCSRRAGAGPIGRASLCNSNASLALTSSSLPLCLLLSKPLKATYALFALALVLDSY